MVHQVVHYHAAYHGHLRGRKDLLALIFHGPGLCELGVRGPLQDIPELEYVVVEQSQYLGGGTGNGGLEAQ